MKKSKLAWILARLVLIFAYVAGQAQEKEMTLDEKVQAFFESKKGTWDDWNVPEYDGRLLYDLIIKNNYKTALEIGTSTGYSTIWMAWALSKTGGKIITIEIDEGRHKEAVANFKAAGLSEYIDARLADAHQLVKKLEGPFDFVFSDADKDWYTNYFKDIYPKLEIDGCFAAHNISDSFWARTRRGGTSDFYKYVKSMKDMETTLDSNGNGMSISYKRVSK